MKLLLQLLANGLAKGALYAAVAVAFGLVWRTLRVFHLALGGLLVWSSYLFFVLVQWGNVPVLAAGLLTLVAASALGIVFEAGLYGPFANKNASSGAVFIASLGIYVIMENVVAVLFGNEVQTISRGIAPTVQIGPVVLTDMQILQMIGGYATVGLLWLLLWRRRALTALWAMGDQPALIPVLGIRPELLRSGALALSGLFGALAAIFVCLDVGTDPHVGMNYVLIGGVAVLVGGTDSFGGWVIGGVALAVLQSFAIWLVPARWAELVTFVLLAGMLLFRPSGLIDVQRRIEERR